MKSAALSLALVVLTLGAAELMARAYFPSKPLFPTRFPANPDCVGYPPCKWRPDYIGPVPGSRISWPSVRGGRTLFVTGLVLTIGTLVAIVGLAVFVVVRVWPHG